ncbi:AMP-binding protein [Archangium lansingense]|uniref:AMP-binding protein n=1 Tax=Archangium lansingense TaxID=2995310 RepID=UPI003B7B3B8B
MLPRGSPVRPEAIERAVLDVIGTLVAELAPPRAGEAIGLDDSLDHDLGLGSLERVELLLRLGQRFGVVLPDPIVASASTPRDLAQAVATAVPALTEEGPPATWAPLTPGMAAPDSARLLTDVLRWHAEHHPERPHLFLRQEDGSERPLHYGELWASASAVAAALFHEGLQHGDTVGLMLRTERAFFPCFLGILLAGGVPVPLYPPFRMDHLEEYVERQVGILRNAGARVLITFDEAKRVGTLLKARVPSLRRTLTPAGLDWKDAVAPPVRLEDSDAALIQYTSGSTGAPKGVLLTHAQLLANIRAIGQALRIHPEDVAVSWLPLYHDMGLIGSWLMPLYYGIPLAILSPLAFLARPSRWLRAVHHHRGTLAAAPNFAYDLCVRKVEDAELEGLDLSSWRVALNGSEAVSPETIERFTRRFAPHGFQPGTMFPAYGLAEVGVALTFPPVGRPPHIEAIEREHFTRRREARPAHEGEETPLRFVSCGRPLPGYQVRIVDGAGRPIGERVEGRIEFRGPSMTSGYFHAPEATRAVLHDGWMDSGDLGYLAGGELYVTGRSKDLIIKAGRNLYPTELEEVVGELPGIRKGCVAAFGLPSEELGTERLVVVAETRERGEEARARLRAAILDRVTAVLGLPPDEVVLAPPGAVRKTSSGKIRRSATREAYVHGELLRGRRAVLVQYARLAGAHLRAHGGRVASTVGPALYTVYLSVLMLLTALMLGVGLVTVRSGPSTDRLVRRIARWMLRAAGCPVRVEGLEHLRGPGPWVLVANHVSYVDSVAILAALPVDFRAVAKQEVRSWPLVGAAVRGAGHLTVDRFDTARGVEGAAHVTEVLRQGTSLLIFPEGTCARGPAMLPFRLGAFKAAVEAGRPVVPIHLEGTQCILRPGSRLQRPGHITLSVGEPIIPAAEGWPEMVRLRDMARARLDHPVSAPTL